MGFKTLLEMVESSSVYQEFIKEHSDAELCAGFFILDFLSNDNKETLDYKIGEKVFTFSLVGGEEGSGEESSGEIGGEEYEIKMGEDKLIEDESRPQLVKIEGSVGVDVDELKNIVGVRSLDEGISAKINKIIAVLQKYDGYGGGDGGVGGDGRDGSKGNGGGNGGEGVGVGGGKGNGGGKQIWNLTCMLDGLIILNVHVDALDGKILKFERKSMMDMIRKVG